MIANGKAALLMIDLEDPYEHGAMWEILYERTGDEPHAHPIARAWALWESTKDDWPTFTATVTGNDRARALQAAYRVSSLLGTSYEEALAEALASKSVSS